VAERDAITTFRDGLARAWLLTAGAYEDIGGRPSLASERPIIYEGIASAKQKFAESERVLAAAEPTAAYPHDQYPRLYTHSDFIHAANLYGLGLIRLIEDDPASAERHIFRSIELAESSWHASVEAMDEPEWAANARNCAALLVDLHALSSVIAAVKGNTESQAAHDRRLQELAAWIKANPA
jgi:hypothetical protein